VDRAELLAEAGQQGWAFRDLRQNPFSAFVLGAGAGLLRAGRPVRGLSLPLAVILVVPMCLLSALAGVALRGHGLNIFTQIGFVVLIGLPARTPS